MSRLDAVGTHLDGGASRPSPLRVLFVCTGNVCRSPYMELRARELAGRGNGVEFRSAGTHGCHDQPMSPEMSAAAGGRLDARGFRSRTLTADLVAKADLVLTAEAAHQQHVLRLHPASSGKVFTLGQFATAVRVDDSAVHGAELVARVAERTGRPADPSLDVADPYRRGAAAGTAAAERIEQLLRVVVPALAGSGRISA